MNGQAITDGSRSQVIRFGQSRPVFAQANAQPPGFRIVLQIRRRFVVEELRHDMLLENSLARKAIPAVRDPASDGDEGFSDSTPNAFRLRDSTTMIDRILDRPVPGRSLNDQMSAVRRHNRSSGGFMTECEGRLSKIP
jgi:hypothetical protein